jgi:uncharacterized protein YdeI (YjbR/CyaY-like superfamily)
MTSEPTFFAASKDWRAWLEENHATASELLVGFYKVGSGRPSMTWPESVDQALCFGWIDGVRKRYDDESYTVRFTPRRAKSTWSAVNINKVEVLKKKGLLHPSGIAAYERHRRLRAAGREQLSRLFVRKRAERTRCTARKTIQEEQTGMAIL